jgi:hypothetical protein
MNKKRKIEIFSAGMPGLRRDHRSSQQSGVSIVGSDGYGHAPARRRHQSKGIRNTKRSGGRHRREAGFLL